VVQVLYPIIDPVVCASRGLDPLAVARACLRGGARLLQLRCKSESSRRFLALADALVAAARPSGARIIVNDRADIARMSGAAGVHVGQDDLSVADVRGILGPDAIVGLSTHDPAQVDAALATTATYIAVGPVYVTGTKDTGYEPRGLDLVRYAAGRGRPVAAIGGITLARAPAVLAAGASTLAVITDLVAGEPEARTRAYLALAAAPERPDHRKNGPR
jgi:thiamine-phosphate pyrophosphorylase